MSVSDDGYYEDIIEIPSPVNSSPVPAISPAVANTPVQAASPLKQNASRFSTLFNKTSAKLLSLQGRKQLSNTIMNEIIDLMRDCDPVELPKNHESLLGK